MAEEQPPKKVPGAAGAKLRKAWAILSAVIASVVLLATGYAAYRLLPNRAVSYADIEEHFKYGSTGAEVNLGIPYWIWQAAPLVCAESLTEVADGRLAPDYLTRAAAYMSDEAGAAEARRQLSREGYKALGLVYEHDGSGQERDLPAGISKRRYLGVDRVFLNCAACHAGTVRKTPDDPAVLVLGMPAHRFNFYAFEHFFFQCAGHKRFSKRDLIPEIRALGGDLSWIDRYGVYPAAIARMRERGQWLAGRLGFSYRQPQWGPGRGDSFSHAKGLLNMPWEHLPDWRTQGKVDPRSLGTADFPSIWLQGPRRKRSDGREMELHWDGNNDRGKERHLSAVISTGALPPSIDHQALCRIESWLLDFTPRNYDDFFPIDNALAYRGEPLYRRYCADCHGLNGQDFTGRRVGFVTPIDEIGTDRYRLDNFTEDLAVNLATVFAGQARQPCSADFGAGGSQTTAGAGGGGRLAAVQAEEENTYRWTHFHKTHGYANLPLDGIWLRAPYLHNGSVPSLRDLLEPSDNRPAVFYRGNDVYDPQNMGFRSDLPEADGKKFFTFDTRVPGNGNQGHEGAEYGTELSADKKNALIEYLKTF